MPEKLGFFPYNQAAPAVPPSLPARPTFAEFYPYYLAEHRRRGTRVLHFIGTTLFLVGAAAAGLMRQPWFGLTGVVAAYGFAWVGHFFVEHNRPATFQYPWLSLRSDFRLYWDLLRGAQKFG